MAYLKCLGAAPSSGSITEEVLWEYEGSYNDNYPLSATIILNDTISNYDCIKFNYINNNDSEMVENSVIYMVDDIKKFTGVYPAPTGVLSCNGLYGVRCRTILYINDNELTINYISGSQAVKHCIPLKITGIKL